MNRRLFPVIFLLLFISLGAEGSREVHETGPSLFILPVQEGSFPVDPQKALVTAGAQKVNRALYEGLVSIDPLTSRAVPGLAASWDTSDDGLLYTFHLRDIFWSDGTPLTAGQILRSWLRVLDPASTSPHAWVMERFLLNAREYRAGQVSVEKLGLSIQDDRTLTVELTGPYPFFPELLVHPSFIILPLPEKEETGTEWNPLAEPVYSGPYLYDHSEEEGKLILVPNPSWWQENQSRPEKVEILPVTGSEDALKMYKTGQTDWLPAELFPLEKIGDLAVRSDFTASPILASYFYVFNMSRTTLDNPAVRQALTLCIDRDQLVEKVLKGSQQPAYSPVPPMDGFERPGPEERDPELRRMKAAGLMTEAGYPGGKDFPGLDLIILESEGHRAVAEYLASVWEEKLGITVEIQGLDNLAFYNSRKTGDFDLALGGWRSLYQDPSAFLNLFLTGESVFWWNLLQSGL